MRDDIAYQIEACEEIVTKAERMLSYPKEEKNVIMLEAPTGSGKTIIAINSIRKLNEKYDNLLFLWVSPATGGLHKQSYQKISENINAYLEEKNKINICLLDDLNSNTIIEMSKFNKNGLIVFNWEKVNEIKDGIFNSKHMIEKGDFFNRTFRYLIEAYKDNNYKIVLVIDECHNLGKNSGKVVEYIDSDIILAMSATPNKEPLTKKEVEENIYALYPRVKPNRMVIVDGNDVILEKMVKENLCVNIGIKNIKEENSKLNRNLQYLKAALNTRELILAEYNKLSNIINKKINPLLIIQIPNGEKGIKLLNEIEDYLAKVNIDTKINKNLTIWLSEDKVNFENVSKYDAKEKCLIFKQGVAQGWDCPRASVLLCYRDSKSKTLEQQVLGRILRTVDQDRYDNYFLDNAFVYTIFEKNEDMEIIKNPFSNTRNSEDDIIVKLKNKDNNIILTRDIRKYNNTKNIDKKRNIESLNSKLEKQILGNTSILELLYVSDLDKILENVEIEETEKGEQTIGTKNVLNYDEKNFTKLKVQSFKYKLHSDLYDEYLKRSVESAIPSIYSNSDIAKIHNSVFIVLRKITENRIKNVINLYKFYFNFRETINLEISNILNTESNDKSNKKDLIETDNKKFKLLDSIVYDSSYKKSDLNFTKYAYNECYLKIKRYATEDRFESNFIFNNEDKIIWWFKNDETKSSFSIQREIVKEKLMYPDYLIKLPSKLLILELKHESQKDTMDVTDKIKTLHKYIDSEYSSNLNIDGGFVIEHNEVFYVSRSSNSRIEDINGTDWRPLSEILAK